MWKTSAQAFTALAAVVNAASGAYAVYAVSQTVQKYGESLAEDRPEHANVKALTDRDKIKMQAYQEVSKWEALSTPFKCLLLSATGFLYMSNVCFMALDEYAFRPFALSSKINDPYTDAGLDGKWWTIIREAGYAFLAVFFSGVILHLIFRHYMKRKTT